MEGFLKSFENQYLRSLYAENNALNPQAPKPDFGGYNAGGLDDTITPKKVSGNAQGRPLSKTSVYPEP